MLSSAPFDNWWHSAYGLDVKILSPPHVLLLTGILAVEFGTLLMILQLRTHRVATASLDWLLFYAGGVVLGNVMIALDELAWRSDMHSARPYRVLSAAVPVILLAVGDRLRTQMGMHNCRWDVSRSAGWLNFGYCRCSRRSPSSVPSYQKVTHFVPMSFPWLLIAPAVVLDLVRARRGRFFQPMGPCRLRRDRICRDAACRSMALRRFSDVARGAQPVLRGTVLSLTANFFQKPRRQIPLFPSQKTL